jgi:ComF family protein
MKSCGFCLKREYQAIDHVTSLAWLTSPYHKLLLLIKYSGQSHFFSYLFRILNPLLTQSVLSPKESPTAVPVPISLRRWLSRSFNQSEFFAMWFADTYQLAYSADFLRKDSRAKPQSSLNEKQRKTELSGHFSCRKNCPIPDSVLLIDDIFTTGYTLDYAARCLKNEGVKKVSAMTLFRTPLRGADI